MEHQLPLNNGSEEATPKFRLHPRQFQVFDCPKRFRVVVAGRRSGKTELALAEIARATMSPNQFVWYVGPTIEEAKDIIWDRLKEMTEPLWARRALEGSLRINLKNGSIIRVKGGFKPDTLRGRGVDFVVLDEAADLKPEVWSHVLRHTLADRKGRALFLGSPKGRNHLYNWFEFAQTDPDNWASVHFTTEQAGIVDKSELDAIARLLDSNVFRQELEAEFTAIGSYRAYLSFNRQANIREVRYEPSQPLIWSLDFNVDPLCMLIMQRIGDVVNVLEEIVVRSNNNTTEGACHKFAERAEAYVKSVGRIYGPLQVKVYGDASGHQRRTSADSTDWNLIRQHFNLYHRGSIELTCSYTNFNPLVRDRINCVNARLMNHASEPQLFINPGCKELIRDLEEVCFAVDSNGAATSELNKSDRHRTHLSDALGYYISQAFPLKGFIYYPR